MIAYRFDDFKGLDSLRVREEEMPQAQRGEILIRVRAVSLNYRDLAMVLVGGDCDVRGSTGSSGRKFGKRVDCPQHQDVPAALCAEVG